MNQIGLQYKALWTKSITDISPRGPDENQKFLCINSTRISRDTASEIEQFLWNEFMNIENNIYDAHLTLIEFCHTQSDMKNRQVGIIFLNQTFENWYKQQKNRMRRTTKYGNHLSTKCNENVCLCVLRDDLVMRAFEFIVNKAFFLLTSLNKLYNFAEKVTLIKPLVDDFLVKPSNNLDKFKLLSEINTAGLYEGTNIDYHEVSDNIKVVFIQVRFYKFNFFSYSFHC